MIFCYKTHILRQRCKEYTEAWAKPLYANVVRWNKRSIRTSLNLEEEVRKLNIFQRIALWLDCFRDTFGRINPYLSAWELENATRWQKIYTYRQSISTVNMYYRIIKGIREN